MLGYLLDTLEYIMTGLLTCFIFIFGYGCILKIIKREISWFCRMNMLFLGLYLTILFSLTVSPMYGYTGSIRFTNVNLMPGQVLKSINSNPINLFGNILMFLPLGILLPLVSKGYRRPLAVIRAGAVISFSIEIMQLFLGRGTDIDDLILNTMGTAAGYFLFLVAQYLFPVLYEKRKKLNPYRIPVFLLTILILSTVILTGFQKRMDDNISVPNVIKHVMDKKADSKTEDKAKDSMESKINRILGYEDYKKKFRFQNLNLEAKNVCFVNVWDKSILYEKESDKKIAPASTTKMQTALTVLRYCKEDEPVTVGKEITWIASDASNAGLRVGNRLTVKQLLEGLLLPSGNDAAYALAVHTGKKIKDNDEISASDAVDIFVKEMNRNAREEGATHSNFVKPDGYDAQGQFTTAYDLACIAGELMKSELLSNIVKQTSIRECFLDQTDITWHNTNELLNPDSKYYKKDTVGIKTGSSELAGKCVISGVSRGSDLYIAVVMGDSEQGRYEDSLTLYDALYH